MQFQLELGNVLSHFLVGMIYLRIVTAHACIFSDQTHRIWVGHSLTAPYSDRLGFVEMTDENCAGRTSLAYLMQSGITYSARESPSESYIVDGIVRRNSEVPCHPTALPLWLTYFLIWHHHSRFLTVSPGTVV